MSNKISHKKHNYKVLGIMSGTSLDGIDLALCSFILEKKKWQYIIHKDETIPYSNEWRLKLSKAIGSNAFELSLLDREFGQYIGSCAAKFLHGEQVDFISSHGHTVFHRPDLRLTLQIGNAASIAAETGLSVVNDFRSLDVALGGQGAPLVPVGDELLFPEYDYCLNLGGFANFSCKINNTRIAWDICPVNIILNKLSPPFDRDGQKGRSGNLDTKLLSSLNQLDYYIKTPPKSLGREWMERELEPILLQFNLKLEDKLRTVYEHIACQINNAIPNQGNVLVSGGGAWNSFLLEIIKEKSTANFILPDQSIVDFKEALIFAFLGVLRMREESNCYASVTGASRDSSSGVITWI